MKLYELLNIDRNHCNFLLPCDNYIKREELENYNTSKHYDLGKKYEAALLGLLQEDRKEIIKSFNNLSLFLVYIDIISWNYNNIALTFAPYFSDNDLMLYNLEMYKLFEFFREPYLKHFEAIKKNPNIIKDGIRKKLIEPSFIEDLRLFPKFALLNEISVKQIPDMQMYEAKKAQLNLWNNTDK